MSRLTFSFFAVVAACAPAKEGGSEPLDITEAGPGSGVDSGSSGSDGGGSDGGGSDGGGSDGGGTGTDPEGTGLHGVVMWLEGNHMPGGGSSGEQWPVSVPVAVFAPLPTSTPTYTEDPSAYGLYEVDAVPLFETTSDAEGRYVLPTDAGDYSLLVGDPEHEGVWYCNGFTDVLCPAAVTAGASTEWNINIDYRAAY